MSVSDLNGDAYRRLRAVNVPHVYSITIFDDDLYWTDWNLKSIMKANKLRGDNETMVQKVVQLPNDLQVVHSLKQLKSNIFYFGFKL